jgi:hypothetical protein
MVTVLIALLLVVGVLWYLSSPHRRTRLRGRWLKRQVERGKAQWGRQRPKPHTFTGRGRGGVGGVVMKGRAKISAKIKRGPKSGERYLRWQPY